MGYKMKTNLPLTILISLLLSSCDTIVEPRVEISQGGEGFYSGNLDDIKLNNTIHEICQIRNCLKINNREKFSDTSFKIEINVTENDSIYIFKLKNNLLYIDLSQNQSSTPSTKTFFLLNDFRNNGLNFTYMGGEKWHCNGKPLKRRYCTQENIPANNQDFLDFILKDNG